MDMLKKIFPFSFKCTDTNAFVVALIIYTVVGVVSAAVLGILSKIPFLGILFGLTGSIVGLYVTIGIVLSILVFTKVIKD